MPGIGLNEPAAGDATRRGKALTGYGITVLLYVTGFGSATASAVLMLAGHAATRPQQQDAWRAMAQITAQTSTAIGVVALALAMARLQGFRLGDLGLSPPSTRQGWLRDVNLAGSCLAAGFATAWAMSLIGHTSSTPFAPHQVLPELAASFYSGPMEEIALLAVPVLILRRACQPFWRVATVLVLLRLTYHLYYGWPTPGIAVWVITVVVLYWRTRRALPIVVAHSSWDLLVGCAHYFLSPAVGAILNWLLLLALLGLGGYNLRRRTKALRPSPDPASPPA